MERRKIIRASSEESSFSHIGKINFLNDGGEGYILGRPPPPPKKKLRVRGEKFVTHVTGRVGGILPLLSLGREACLLDAAAARGESDAYLDEGRVVRDERHSFKKNCGMFFRGIACLKRRFFCFRTFGLA